MIHYRHLLSLPEISIQWDIHGPEEQETEKLLAFRTEVRDFLAENLDDELRTAARLTIGVHSHIDAGQRWYRILSRKGWIAPTWPREYGGTGWTARECHIFGVECFLAGAPLLFNMGVRHLGPVLMGHGSPEQKAHYLPRILSGEDIWCQGYSEPSAGSDLASLRLSALRVADDYVLNGSKMWTTGAQFATHMFCLVRTSDEGKKQRGITFLLLRMDTPGIQVKPILNIAGEHECNQVFFDDVHVPVNNRVGPENEGWKVAKVLMQFARSNNVNTGWVREALERLKRITQIEQNGFGATLSDDYSFMQRLLQVELRLHAVEAMEQELLAVSSEEANSAAGVHKARNTTRNPGAKSSMLKTLGSEVKQQITELTAEAVGHYALPHQVEALDPFEHTAIVGPTHALTAMPAYLSERGATIYSGSSEVQRDVLARSILGL